MKRLLIVLVTGVCLSPALLAGVARADSTATVELRRPGERVDRDAPSTRRATACTSRARRPAAQDGVTPTVVAPTMPPTPPPTPR